MKKQWIFGLLLLLVAAFLVYRFAGQNVKEDEHVVKIGAILPLTGKYADLGHWTEAGLLSAIEELKTNNPNSKIKVIVEDAKSEAKEALSAYNKLVNVEKVNIIVTTSSALCLAIKPRAIADNVLFFGIASHPEITNNNNGKIFRPCNTSIDEGEEICNFINKYNEKNKRVSILYHNSEFGQSFNKQISDNLKNTIVGSNSYDDKPESFKTLTIKTLAEKPNMIVAIGFTPSLGVLIKNLRESKYEGIIISNIGFSTPSVISASGEYAKGVYFVDYNLPTKSTHFQTIDSISRVKFNTKFASISYLSYFTLKVIDKAISEKKSSKIADIANYLAIPQDINIDGIVLTSKSTGNIVPKLEIKKYDY